MFLILLPLLFLLLFVSLRSPVGFSFQTPLETRKKIGAAYDILLRAYCEGERGRRAGRQCLATQPSLFHHHRTAGPETSMSDISNHGGHGGFREKALTDMVRWSVRLNADALMEGRTDFVDQYPDK